MQTNTIAKRICKQSERIEKENGRSIRKSYASNPSSIEYDTVFETRIFWLAGRSRFGRAKGEEEDGIDSVDHEDISRLQGRGNNECQNVQTIRKIGEKVPLAA